MASSSSNTGQSMPILSALNLLHSGYAQVSPQGVDSDVAASSGIQMMSQLPSREFNDGTTFGISLQVLLLYPLARFTAEGHDPFSLLHEEFVNGGLRVSSYESKLADGWPARYDTWRIDMDLHELTENEFEALPDNQGSISVKLISPTFVLYEETAWRTEINLLMHVLERMKRTACRIMCNEQSGLHCHVGNKAQPIPLETAKRILKTVTAFERCFDILHSVSRIQHGQNVCAPPSRFFGPRHQQPAVWLRMIREVQSHEQLRELFVDTVTPDVEWTNGKYSAYNFDNLQSDDQHSKNTIEFRQHLGTINREEICNWVMLCGHLVRNHAWLDDLNHIQWMRLRMHDPTFGLVPLLQFLRIPLETIAFYAQRIGTHIGRNGRPHNNYVENKYGKMVSEIHSKHPLRPIVRAIAQNRLADEDLWTLARAMGDKYARGEYGNWGVELGAHEFVQLPLTIDE